jgi:hypothetical protein
VDRTAVGIDERRYAVRTSPSGSATAIGVTLLLLAALVLARPAAATDTGSLRPPRFALHQIGPQDGGGEPSTAIARDGTIYVSAPGDAMEFYRSTDRGVTWTKGASPESPSGDTSVNVDSSGAVYESNLHGLEFGQDTLQADIFKSFDGGATWPQMGTSAIEDSNTTGQPALVDRQWVDASIPSGGTTDTALVYVTYHDWGPSQIWVSGSSDGGKTFGLPVDVVTSPEAQLDSFCDTIPGGLKVVPAGLRHAGRVFVTWLAADPANPLSGCNETQLAAFHSVWVAYSDDHGATWTDQLVFDGGVLHDGSEIFDDLTLDDRGNPYIAFPMNLADQFDVYVEASFDGGLTWNGKSDGTGQPYKVDVDTGTHYFAAIAAGKPGRVDVAYLGTDVVVPTTPYGKPEPGGDANASWDVYMAQSVDLLSGSPTWTNVRLTPSPMHVGDICTLGIFCAAIPDSNRNLLDFIDIAVDAHGLAHVAYTDDNNYTDGALVMANQVGGSNVGPGGH